MKLYTIYSASEAEQALILSQIPLIGQLQEPYQQKTLDAYATALKNSTFPSLADAPFSRHSTHYRLLAHINEVAEAGLMLADFAYSIGRMNGQKSLTGRSFCRSCCCTTWTSIYCCRMNRWK